MRSKFRGTSVRCQFGINFRLMKNFHLQYWFKILKGEIKKLINVIVLKKLILIREIYYFTKQIIILLKY